MKVPWSGRKSVKLNKKARRTLDPYTERFGEGATDLDRRDLAVLLVLLKAGADLSRGRRVRFSVVPRSEQVTRDIGREAAARRFEVTFRGPLSNRVSQDDYMRRSSEMVAPGAKPPNVDLAFVVGRVRNGSGPFA